jgi:pyruvate-ferredoxin/flavodoxin oxidoreductase
LDSKPPSLPLRKYALNEMRYSLLAHSSPATATELLEHAQADILARWRLYEHWASMPVAHPSPEEPHA